MDVNKQWENKHENKQVRYWRTSKDSNNTRNAIRPQRKCGDLNQVCGVILHLNIKGQFRLQHGKYHRHNKLCIVYKK